jgi:hypothetical protein
MLLEILSGSSYLDQTEVIEDKTFCTSGSVFPDRYLSKCDTWYCNKDDLKITLNRNPSMKILWTIRNPKDMCLSKLRRGRPISEGGDCHDGVSADATYDGCMFSLRKMFDLYKTVEAEFADRLLVVKMEDIIRDIEGTTVCICEFIGIPFEKNMLYFMSRMRNRFKKKRYGNGVDKTQLDLWKRYRLIYDGFFTDKVELVERLFDDVSFISEEFGYQ